MAFGVDGALYVAANGAGEILRVDPADGATCVVASGLPTVSSVKYNGMIDGALTFYATTFTGDLLSVAYRPS